MTTVSITEVEYHEAVESSRGWCTHCKRFTRDETEPDAEDYECPECGSSTVIGAEAALVADEFEFSDLIDGE